MRSLLFLLSDNFAFSLGLVQVCICLKPIMVKIGLHEYYQSMPKLLDYNARAHIHARTHTRGRTYTHARAYARTRTRTHTHTHTHARTRARTHTHARTRIHTHARSILRIRRFKLPRQKFMDGTLGTRAQSPYVILSTGNYQLFYAIIFKHALIWMRPFNHSHNSYEYV